MIKRAFRIPAFIVAIAAMLFVANPISVQADWWSDYNNYEYGYYDDNQYDDDWYYDYYTYDSGDDDRLAGTSDEVFEERGEYEKGTAFDDPGDEGWFDV